MQDSLYFSANSNDYSSTILVADDDIIDSPTILVADDDDIIARLLYDYFQAQGYHVHIASNGVEALQCADSQHPDLVLMDVWMPEMDGLEAIRRIRTDHQFDGLPIITLTALAMPGDRERCMAAGATAYITKPVSLKTLSQMISQLLPHHSSYHGGALRNGRTYDAGNA